MGVRRHPVVLAAILSDLVVRTIEIAAAIKRGRRGNLDRAFIRTLARDLGRDLGRAREYAQVRHLKLDVTVTPDSILALTLDQAREPYLALTLIRDLDTALRLAHKLSHAIDGTLARYLDLRLNLSRDEDLELVGGLAADLDSDLDRALELNRALGRTRERILNVNYARDQILDIDRSISHTLDTAFQRSRALDRVCAQGVADRLGISTTERLAEALLDGAMDDFTNADLTCARLAGADLTGVRWSLPGTIWPLETDVSALLARSEEVEPGGGVLVVKRRGSARGAIMAWPPKRLPDWLKPANQRRAMSARSQVR